jgi:hypothetical protein
MTTKDLIFAANILLDVEEMHRDGGKPSLEYIKRKCAEFKIPEAESDLIKLASRCTPVYNVGSVNYDFDSQLI